MKNSFKIFLPLIALILIFNSCKKQNQEYLLGEWNLISKPVEELEYKWYFNSSKVYVMATDGNENEAATGELDTCSFGAYILKNGVLTMALKEAPCRGSVFNGDWDIQGLTEEYMTLRRETSSGTQWYEFTKKGSENEETTE